MIQDERTGALSTLNNQSVCCGVDVYNQDITGETAASVTAAAGGTNTSGPKVMVLNDQGGQSRDVVFCSQGNGIDRADTAGCNGKGWTEDVGYTLNTIDRPAVYDARGNGDGVTSPTITGDHENRVTDYTALCVGNGQMCNMSMAPVANSLDCMHDQQAVYIPDVAHALKGKANCQFAEDKETYVAAVDCRNATENADTNGTLQAKEQGQNLNSNNVCRCGSVVRRLTPLECERLQGYPDGWTDIGEWTDSKGKRHKDADSPRYKALGNSIALPFWAWLARRICAQYERPMTMASLFDGIGGFPLVFSRVGCKPVWASEIE